MAKVILHAGISRLSGRIGDFVYRNVRGRTFITQAPRPSNAPPSERQLAARCRFRLAGIYARTAMDNPPARAFYDKLADAQNVSTFAAAQRDYLSAPVIDDIALALYHGQREDEILIHAHDDTEVVSVTVTIKNMVGKTVEHGAAQLFHGVWIYEATTTAPAGQPLTIHVTAMDRPGNEVTRSAPWVPGMKGDVW